jgi:hypothetical protein
LAIVNCLSKLRLVAIEAWGGKGPKGIAAVMCPGG